MPQDNNPPPELKLSIVQFVDLLRDLLEGQRTADFIHLVLAGTFEGQDVVIDALETRLYDVGDEDVEDDELYPYDMSRDIDSVLGVSDHICVFGKNIAFALLPKHSESLSKDVGISRRLQYNGVTYGVDLHRIPNVGFARWCDRNEIRLFFPGLWRPKVREHHHVTADESRLIYDITRGVFNALLPNNRGGNLPPSMDAELFRARGPDGRIHFGRRILDEESARQLGDCLRDAIEEAIEDGKPVEWARGFFFLHQIRGVKDGHPHSPARAQEAFEAFIDHHGLSIEVLNQNPDDWVFDIGVEASSTSGEDSLAFRADSHYHILVDVCGIEPHHARRMTSVGSTLYCKDFTSHLVDVAGCRIDTGTGPARGDLGVLKVQMYQTDKNVTANPSEGAGHHAKYTTLSQAVDKGHPRYFDNVFNLYESSEKRGIVSNARLEVRVPYRFQHLFYSEGNEANWRKYLIYVPCDAWWGLRYLPIVAYKMVAHYQFSSSPTTRTTLRAVTLLAIIIWLTNCLHATPDTGWSSRQLLTVTLPLIPRADIDDRVMPFRISKPNGVYGIEPDEGFDDGNMLTPDEAVQGGGAFNRSSSPAAYPFNQGPAQDRNDELVPAYLRGYMFIRGIVYDVAHPVPMMTRGPSYLSEGTFKYMYGAEFGSFQAFVYLGELFTTANPARNRNRVRQHVYIPPPGTQVPIVFELPDGHLTLPDIGFGSIIGEDDSGSDSGSDSDDETKITRNAFVSKLYHQILVDSIATSPNPKQRADSAYCYILKEDSDQVTEAIFKDRNIGRFFRAARMKVGTPAEWQTAFDHLLPTPRAPPKVKKAQNYPKCSYYTVLWPHYIAHVPHEAAMAARDQIKKRIDNLSWIPWAKSDRIWETSSKRDKDVTRNPGLGEKMPAPHILCSRHWKWDSTHIWVSKKNASQGRAREVGDIDQESNDRSSSVEIIEIDSD